MDNKPNNDKLWEKISSEYLDFLKTLNFTSAQEFVSKAEELAMSMSVLRYFDEHEFPEEFAVKLCKIDNLSFKLTDKLLELFDQQVWITESLNVLINEEFSNGT